MTRKISLFVGTALVALTVAAPAAFGEGRLAGSIGQDESATQVSRPDSHDIFRAPVTNYLDANDRAHRINVVVPTAMTDSHERADVPSGFTGRGDVTANPISDGTEWPALGLAFGLGVALVAGLWLASRNRFRPLAH